MKLNVLLDMDGVIANFYYGFAKYLNEKHGCSLDLDTSPPSYDFSQWGGGTDRVDIKEASIGWITERGFDTLPAFKDAEKFVKELDSICNLYIVTARSGKGEWKNDIISDDLIDKIQSDTKTWLERHNMPTDKLFFIKDKVPFCEINGISVLIEDKLDTALKASKEGLHSILINMNYNSSPADRLRIYRVYNLEEALEWVKKLSKK